MPYNNEADEISYHLINKLVGQGNAIVMPRFYINNYECDVFAMTQKGYTIDYEIKVDYKDFKNDFNKEFLRKYRLSKYPKKHDLLKDGKATNKFYFVSPLDILEEIPPYAGFIKVAKNGIVGYSFKTLKRAPLLKKEPENIDKKAFIFTIASRCNWRYLQQSWKIHSEQENKR